MALAAPIPNRVLSPKAILDLVERRLAAYASRNSLYDENLRYYFGQQSRGGGAQMPILAASATGRPLLRQVGESINAHRAYTSQRLAPIIDDFTALGGIMPASRVEQEDNTPEAEQRAVKRTKFLLSTHELSKMDLQQPESAFWLSGLGDSLYTLDIDRKKKRVVWNVVNPRNAYPSFYRGYRRFDVYDVLIVEVWEPSEINATFGADYGINVPYDASPKQCTVTEYLSPYQRTFVVGVDQPQRGPHVEWDLDFCPASWAFNKVPGNMGMADIAHAKGQQDFLDWAMNVAADGLVHNTYPLVVIKNPAAVGQDEMVVGPGATIPVGPDGDVQVRHTQGDLQAWHLMTGQTLSDMNAATGSSEVRQEGRMEGSIITGRAVQSVQGPQATRIALKKQILGAVLRDMNAKTLQMQETAPYLKDATITIYGSYKGQSFRDDFSAADINGWYRNAVAWEEMVGMNLQQKIAIANEGMATRLWDDIQARDLVGIEDPLGMRERIKTMTVAEAKMMAEANAASQSAQQQGSGTATGTQAPTPSTDSASSPAPAAEIFRPPHLARAMPQGLATGTPMGVSVKAVANALAPLTQRLKGSVYAIGQLATQGQADNVTLAITDARDYTVVTSAVKALDTAAKVRAMNQAQLPPEARQIA